jgi:hypothetical protein
VMIDLASHGVDTEATRALRRSIRAHRLETSEDQIRERREVAPSGRPINEYLQQTSSGTIQCTWCGKELAPAGVRWKERAVSRASPISSAYAHSYEDKTLCLREYFCAGCGIRLDCEVARPDDAPIHDDVYLTPSRPSERS